MFKGLLPKEAGFFDFFEQHSLLAIEACKELHAIALNPAEMKSRAARIREIEHQADNITHKCIDALHRTFITPIDRTDIHHLIKKLDDVVDSLDSTASRMILYELTTPRPEFKLFTEVLTTATQEINGAIHHLREMKKSEKTIEKYCRAIYEAENRGDQVLRAALAALFNDEKEAGPVIKWKDIFERMEVAIDRCEDVANIVEGIVIEAS
ncbi:conserved hypothetical protein [Candidatus Zixiibacteriota bacterium]|nr:conserved hypothetical protein [candidate division Zixibacteria bacterium]